MIFENVPNTTFITKTSHTILCGAVRIHLGLVQVFKICEPNRPWRRNLHQSTFLAELQKALEAHGRKPWVNQLIDRSPYIRYTNRKYHLLYNTT